MTWFQRLHGRDPREGLLFGIEIEIEGSDLERNLNDMNTTDWIVESDGSLRNGYEFKSRRPVDYQSALSALQQYDKFLSSARCSATARTSVHIHVNVQDLTDDQLKSFIWLSVALEPVIMKFCTELRNHNGYCIPVHKSTNGVSSWRRVVQSLSDRGNLRRALEEMPKYAATGGFRMRDLGTIEFRMFPGCTYAPKIAWYLDIITSIYEQAKLYTVHQLQDKKVSDGVTSLISSVIVDNRKRVTVATLNELIEIGIRMANDIVRTPMTVEDLKALRNKLIPSSFQPWTSSSLSEIVSSSDPVAALKMFDPEDIRANLKSEFHLFVQLKEAGVPVGRAFELSSSLFKEYSL